MGEEVKKDCELDTSEWRQAFANQLVSQGECEQEQSLKCRVINSST